MKTSRTHRTPKAEATERASEAAAILREETQAMDDTARERAHQAAREAASEAKAKREIARKHQLKVEVNEIIDTRERALREITKYMNELTGTVISEERLIELLGYFGSNILDVRVALDHDGGRWGRWNADDGTRYVKKY